VFNISVKNIVIFYHPVNSDFAQMGCLLSLIAIFTSLAVGLK
jgi:hypothetical protein